MKELTTKNLNVFLLSLGMCLSYTAFDTFMNMQTLLISKAQNATSAGYVEGYTGVSYYSLVIIVAVSTLLNRLSPPVNALIGLKLTLTVSAAMFMAYIAQFYYMRDALLYAGSVLAGVGNALFFPTQDSMLSINSDETTISRNAGFFWTLFFCNHLLGNGAVYFIFGVRDDIDIDTRQHYLAAMLSFATAGFFTFLLLRPTPWQKINKPESPIAALKNSFILLSHRDMLLLLPYFFFVGLQTSFGLGIYGTCVGFSKAISHSYSFPLLQNVLYGLGGVSGGALFWILGSYINRNKLYPGLAMGISVEFAGLIIAFLHLPNTASLGETMEMGVLMPSMALALIPGFCLGFGDACFNMQAITILRRLYPEIAAHAFVMFRLVQNLAEVAAFFYAGHLGLYYQLGIILGFGFFGAATFVFVDYRLKEKMEEESLPNASSVTTMTQSIQSQKDHDSVN